MSDLVRLIRMKVRLIAGILTAAVAGGGALAALSSAPYAPASHAYVDERVDSALQTATARIGNLQRESGETRLQLNQLRRDTLRGNRWTVSEQMKGAAGSQERKLLQQRLDQIDDDLKDVDAERERLRFMTGP